MSKYKFFTILGVDMMYTYPFDSIYQYNFGGVHYEEGLPRRDTRKDYTKVLLGLYVRDRKFS